MKFIYHGVIADKILIIMKLILKELSLGRPVQKIGKGNSMNPYIKEGDIIQLEPYTNQQLNKGTIVLVRIGNKFLTHQIIDIKDNMYLIGNGSGKEDGLVKADAIYGIVTNIGKDDNFSGLTIKE